jgi:hypothetical protein
MTNGRDRGEVVPGRHEDGAELRANGNIDDGVPQDHLRALSAVRAELTRLEEAICGGHHQCQMPPTE